MIKHPDCKSRCQQAELVGMPEVSCFAVCHLALHYRVEGVADDLRPLEKTMAEVFSTDAILGRHYGEIPDAYLPPDSNEHPAGCKCQRCGGDQ